MITEEVKAQMREIATRYPVVRSAMLPCLHVAQAAEGRVTPEGMQAVAETLNVKLDEVDSVVSFYSMYSRVPLGKHVIKVCTSISCYLMGCDAVLARLEQELGVRAGETTTDGEFTLEGAECIAACGLAPALQVNYEFIERVGPDDVAGLLARLRRGESVEDLGGRWEFGGRPAGAAEDEANGGRRAAPETHVTQVTQKRVE